MNQKASYEQLEQRLISLEESYLKHKLKEEELDLIVRLVPGIICTAGTDGYFKNVNPAMEKLLGFTKEELLSRPLFDFIHPAPADRNPVKTESNEEIGGRRHRSFQNRYLCKDGSYRLLEWVTTSAVDGIFYAVARDITEQKLAEQIIEKKNRELYRKSQDLKHSLAAERQARSEAEIMLQAFEVFTTKLDLKEITTHLEKFIKGLVPHHGSTICFYEGEACRIVSVKGNPKKQKNVGQIMGPTVLLSKIKQTGSPILVPDIIEDKIDAEWEPHARTRTWLAVPISAHGQNFGCFTLESWKKDAFDPSAIRLVQALVNEAAIAFENARLFKEIEKLSTVDPLTGLHNRRHFYTGAQLEFMRALRYDLPLSAIMMDIDHFKLVNDNHGHAVGDRVLTEVAAVCRNQMRSMDQVARYGGEEFCFLLPETPVKGAFNFAERLRKNVTGLLFNPGGKKIAVTASFGVAERLDDKDTLEDLLKRCDMALYEAKAKGRDRVTQWPFA